MINNRTVPSRTIPGLSAVILLIVGMCVFASLALCAIASQVTALRSDSVPGIYLAGRIQAGSVATASAVERFVLEPGAAAMQGMPPYLQGETTEELDLIRQYDITVLTTLDRALVGAARAVLAPLTNEFDEVIRLGKAPRTKAEAETFLRGRFDVACGKFEEATRQIRASVSRSQTGIGAGYLVVQAANRSLARLMEAVAVMRQGDDSRKILVSGTRNAVNN